MAQDTHFGTGAYDPETYWDRRAVFGGGDVFRAVCGFALDRVENAAMHRVQEAVLRALLGGLPLRDRRVLELGCGAGRWVPFFRRRGCLYTGVDLSAEMLKVAHARFPELPWHHLATSSLPFSDGSFDLAVSITVLHHNPPQRQEELLSELVRVTRPTGHILLMEGVAPPDGRTPCFNMFPRTVEGWMSALPPQAAVVLKVRGARWWLTRDLVAGLLHRLGRRRRPRASPAAPPPASPEPNSSRRRLGRGESLLLRLGGRIDPVLVRLLPRRWASNVGILYRRS